MKNFIISQKFIICLEKSFKHSINHECRHFTTTSWLLHHPLSTLRTMPPCLDTSENIWKLKIVVLAWMVIILLTHSLHFVGFKFVRQTVIWPSVHLYLLRMAPSKCLQKCKCVPKMCQLWLVTTFLKWWSGHNLCSTYIFIWTLSYGEIFKSTSVYL